MVWILNPWIQLSNLLKPSAHNTIHMLSVPKMLSMTMRLQAPTDLLTLLSVALKGPDGIIISFIGFSTFSDSNFSLSVKAT